MDAAGLEALTKSGALATAAGGVGKVAQGMDASRFYGLNADIARQNAVIASQVASQQEAGVRSQGRAALGKQRAALAEAGIGTEGSAADVIRQSRTNAELDALNTRYEGTMRARAYETDASLYDTLKGGAMRAGFAGGAGDILTSVSQYAGVPGNKLSDPWNFLKKKVTAFGQWGRGNPTVT